MSRALDGIRVIDFTHDQAGPSSTQILSWLGADVIKIERPGIGDRARRLWADRDDADSYFFFLLNSGKRSISLNLKSAEGNDIVLRLIRQADIVTENLGPGVMDRLGLSYQALSELNPRLIYASVKGFGSFGPYSGYKCFEMVAQATSGAMSVTGSAEGPPLISGINAGDSGTGMHLALGMVTALFQRERTGRGQLVEVAMQESVLNLTRVKFTPTLSGGKPVARTGNRGGSGYSDLIRCAGGGPNDCVYMMLGNDMPEAFSALQRVIEREDLRDDERFSTPQARRQHAAELSAVIEEWTAGRSKHEVMAAFASQGIPCGAVLDTSEVLSNPHLRERGMIVEIEHPVRGRFSMISCPVRLSASPVEPKRAPLLGEHTEEVLTTLAGYSASDIERLRQQEVI